MAREYELMYIVRPELDDEGVNAAVASVASLIEGNGGEVVRTTVWGKRRLAYEVQRLRDGYYVILNVQLDPAKVSDIERALRIHETVFRHLLVAADGLPPAAPDTAERAVRPVAVAIPEPLATEDEELEAAEVEAVPAGVEEEF